MDPRILGRLAKIGSLRRWFLLFSCARLKLASNFDNEVAAISKAANAMPSAPFLVLKKWCFSRTQHRQCRPYVHPPPLEELEVAPSAKNYCLTTIKKNRAAMGLRPLRCAREQKGRCSSQAKVQYEPARPVPRLLQ
ncbi:hypothetical protein CEXT_778771 [Caerostris extrusa]|uniref:Uncharacterized protein n=1 Tax=Caerostris extrusa TaxID=172846 RepID=A0AAV4MTG8_CAEEX|nr:hypothetical protein CEXT_300701 [Caerostris extrusa]GIX86230.1 hypothetical protein CEXT_778771 [Caerostris extrusa]